MAYDSEVQELESKYKNLPGDEFAEEAVRIATMQILASSEFKKPRVERLNKYWSLYDGNVPKKLRQLFNVPIPVFAGMIDTLNAQYDTPVVLKFKEGDASDYFKVEKINGAFQMEVMDVNQNSKWDAKLRIARKHAIINGRAILEYNVSSDPEYFSELNVINLKNFNFQPEGGLWLENHLFAGTEDIKKTKAELLAGAKSGLYNKKQVEKLISLCEDREYMPQDLKDYADRLARFKPLGLDPQSHTYIGQAVYRLASQIIEINGTRYYVCFHPFTRTWIRFEKWRDICSSDLYPWVSYATHEDDENFLSKSFADDLFPAADAVVAMFNQELTNREKRNFGSRAYDKDMFPDVRKLDEAQHRPDGLVPVDTKNGTRQIGNGIYHFETPELQGTVNLIDWIQGTIGRHTGANDLAQGSTIDTSKKASVTFAEQKSVSKRLGWASKPFQGLMADLGKRYVYGLKDHMPAKMAVRVLGATGWDWDEISRLDLDTKKDVDVLIVATDQELAESEMRAKRRTEALGMIIQSPFINGQKRDEEILRSVGEYSDEEIAEFLDVKTYRDKKALARAADSIQRILRGEEPSLWYGANIAFVQKILDFANDRRSTLKEKFELLVNYAMEHTEIVRENIDRQVAEDMAMQQNMAAPLPAETPEQSQSVNPGMPGGMSKAMQVAESAV